MTVLRKIARILWNIVTRAEVTREYPEKALEVLWSALARPVQSWRAVQAIGKLLHRRVCRVQQREAAADYTRFFRNLPQLEVLRDIALHMAQGAQLRMAVLGCSTGAELYSALWMIRTTRPDLKVSAVGIDISETCIQKAVAGIYPLGMREVEGISKTTYGRLFVRQGDALSVRDWLREGVIWRVANACSPALAAEFGLQDIVLANNFLCHMSDECAEDCLMNIARLVAPDGYLFVWGVDLEVRTRLIRDLDLIPVRAKLEEIYAADQAAREAWPLKYWGIEPMDKRRIDWTMRYATIFRMPGDIRSVSAEHPEYGVL